MNSNWKESDKKIIDVSKKEVDDIKKLVLGLWNTTSAPVGAGRDAIGLSHQTIQVIVTFCFTNSIGLSLCVLL